MRDKAERVVILLASMALLIALIHLVWDRGGPYFEPPTTIVEHVFRTKHDVRDVLVLLPKVRPLLPRGATVTCFRPVNGKFVYDLPNFNAAIGQLPHQVVIPPFSAAEDIPRKTLVQYVIAVNEPFTHPAYRLVAEFPEGRLYLRQ